MAAVLFLAFTLASFQIQLLTGFTCFFGFAAAAYTNSSCV